MSCLYIFVRFLRIRQLKSKGINNHEDYKANTITITDFLECEFMYNIIKMHTYI